MSRRAMLGALGLAASGAAASAVTSCGARMDGPTSSPTPTLTDPVQALLAEVISGKEQLVALYRQASLGDATRAARLAPFEQRHQAHLAALRRHLEKPLPTMTPQPTSTVTMGVTMGMVRDAERKAAASRPGQLATMPSVPPVLSQLLSSIGACEALHVVALRKVT